MEKVNGAWICSSVFRSRNHNDGVSLFPSSSSIFLFPLLLLFLLLPSLASPRGSRSIFLSLFLSVSRVLSFFTPRFTHVHIYIYTRIQRQGCSICKIAEYGRKMQAACMPIWRAWLPRSFLSRSPSLYESASKIQILTLTLRPKCWSRPSIVSLVRNRSVIFFLSLFF